MITEADFILWIVIGAVAAFLVALGIAKFAVWFQNRRAIKRAEKFLSGKEKNIFLMDGEKINLNKMIVKDLDGKMVKVIVGEQPTNVLPHPSKH